MQVKGGNALELASQHDTFLSRIFIGKRSHRFGSSQLRITAKPVKGALLNYNLPEVLLFS